MIQVTTLSRVCLEHPRRASRPNQTCGAWNGQSGKTRGRQDPGSGPVEGAVRIKGVLAEGQNAQEEGVANRAE